MMISLTILTSAAVKLASKPVLAKTPQFTLATCFLRTFFDLILNAISEQDYMIKNAHTMHHLLAGELGQMAERFNLSQDFNDYLTNVKGKTAALFRLAAEEGSHFGNGDEQTTQALASFGENLGIAFQIVDDILDYTGGKHLNKPTLEDLTTGVYSLPILLALSKKELREQLVPLLEKKATNEQKRYRTNPKDFAKQLSH